MQLLTQARNNVSPLELRRQLGVSYRTAWLVKHKLLQAMVLAESARQLSGRSFRRLHVQGLIAKVPRTRRWRETNHGRNVIGTSLYLREHHFPNVYSGVVH